ncbi:hypothetical protein JCM19314_3695 [Nonlabens ulvanivorans]|uniref:Uncharacterized protein n=1 Tax=Nonlabens ulvanivorans TaxID=906888 RepID=A0A081DB63_NONUL|nr:hypothetical protein [Nonlabens ulvanivorans]GAK76159.1 hypothetical protein JCM19296_1756 [Nonlabens ulvanivorans]GAK99650.1 hypothetical protein JCM19314_3695 [Nonlabens ulvanivorans]
MNKVKMLQENFKYLIALLSVFNFLLTPIHIMISGFNPAYIVVVNYTLVILSSSLIASIKTSKIVTYILGCLTLSTIWLEFNNSDSKSILICRLVLSLLLFACFCIILVRQLLKIKEINLQFILGPILGFLYLGIIGGTLFELIHFLILVHSNSSKDFLALVSIISVS